MVVYTRFIPQGVPWWVCFPVYKRVYHGGYALPVCVQGVYNGGYASLCVCNRCIPRWVCLPMCVTGCTYGPYASLCVKGREGGMLRIVPSSFPFHCWVYSCPSLCTTAFCSGFKRHYCPFHCWRIFLCGTLFPFHCWSTPCTLSTPVSLLDTPGPTAA